MDVKCNLISSDVSHTIEHANEVAIHLVVLKGISQFVAIQHFR